jgi:hypothetical protein
LIVIANHQEEEVQVKFHHWWRERRNRTGEIRDVLARSEQPSRLDRLDGRTGTTARRGGEPVPGTARPDHDSTGFAGRDEAQDW